MTDTQEIRALIDKAAQAGARVRVEFDSEAMINEGRLIIDTVQVSGLAGVGPNPMPAVSAAERLRATINH